MPSSTRAATSRTSSGRRPRHSPIRSATTSSSRASRSTATSASRANEDSPLEELADDKPVDRLLDDYSNYGALKVLCERAVEETMPDRHALVRPGPHRRSARPDRAIHLLAPPDCPRRRSPRPGAARANRPVRRRPRPGELVDRPLRTQDRRNASTRSTKASRGRRSRSTCRDVAGSDASFTYVDGDYLLEQGWASGWSFRSGFRTRRQSACTGPTSRAQSRRGSRSARSTRPSAARSTRPRRRTTAGMAAEREAEILAAWKAR